MLSTMETTAQRLIQRTPAARVINPERATRFLEFGIVGLSGAGINTLVFLTLITDLHYLAAGSAAFLVAVSWNFSWNYLITFGRPAGDLHQQYAQFVAVSLGGFAVYSATLAVAISGVGATPLAANLVAIGVSGAFNFLGADEFAFDEHASLGQKTASSINRAAHLAYRGRLKHAIRGTALYHAAYRGYCRIVGVLTPATYDLPAGDATVPISTATGAEAVSVLHTLRKERPVIQRFADDVHPGDVVWDLGANLGVYSLVAAANGGEVVAVEAYRETAVQLAVNADRAGVGDDIQLAAVAVTDRNGEMRLAVERAEVGTQTPAPDAEDGVVVPAVRCDDQLVDGAWPAPDVIKLDVEGGEPAALQGMELALAGARVIYVEVHSDADAAAVRELLKAAGFTVERVHRYGRESYLRGERGDGNA